MTLSEFYDELGIDSEVEIPDNQADLVVMMDNAEGELVPLVSVRFDYENNRLILEI